MLKPIDQYRTEDDLDPDNDEDCLTDEEQLIADTLRENGDAFGAYWHVMRSSANDVGSLVDGFEDAYIGKYDSFRDFADERAGEELAERIKDQHTRDWVEEHFDYEYYARELEHSYFYHRMEYSDGSSVVYVFANV